MNTTFAWDEEWMYIDMLFEGDQNVYGAGEMWAAIGFPGTTQGDMMENGDVILCYRAMHDNFYHTGCFDVQLNANAVADGSGVANTLDNDPFREIDSGTTRSLGITFNDTEGHRWWLATAKRRIQDTDASN